MSVLRQLVAELRSALPDRVLHDNLAFKYILAQYQKYQTTDQQICRAKQEMQFIASTYLTYLRSSRLQREIQAQYHGKGERTTNETAQMVGFKLPHDPK